MKSTYRPILDSVFGILLAVSLGLNVYQMVALSKQPKPEVVIQDLSYDYIKLLSNHYISRWSHKPHPTNIRYICGHIQDKEYCVEAYNINTYDLSHEEVPIKIPQMSKFYHN